MYPFRTRLTVSGSCHSRNSLQSPKADARIRTADPFIGVKWIEGLAARACSDDCWLAHVLAHG